MDNTSWGITVTEKYISILSSLRNYPHKFHAWWLTSSCLPTWRWVRGGLLEQWLQDSPTKTSIWSGNMHQGIVSGKCVDWALCCCFTYLWSEDAALKDFRDCLSHSGKSANIIQGIFLSHVMANLDIIWDPLCLWDDMDCLLPYSANVTNSLGAHLNYLVQNDSALCMFSVWSFVSPASECGLGKKTGSWTCWLMLKSETPLGRNFGWGLGWLCSCERRCMWDLLRVLGHSHSPSSYKGYQKGHLHW